MKTNGNISSSTFSSDRIDSTPRTRFITAASLFDGHDAAINIMRRILQSSGAEVIHLGHNRSVDSILKAALQEDAQAIAISSYQGGHVEFFKYIIDRLKKEGLEHIKVFGGGGGTITPTEILDLEKYGVKKIYSPEDGRALGLQGIIDDMITHSKGHPFQQIDWDHLKDFAKSPKALAQALTCLELGDSAFQDPSFTEKQVYLKSLRQTMASASGKATVVGLTGPGGAGKSSLTDELVLRVLEEDSSARVAVLAIDPSRRKTGGALLGDRLRMNSLSSDRTFMRSFATRQANASLSEGTKEAIALYKAAGFDWIFVETGGIGQADTSIVDLVDINFYVMTAEFGAPTQLEKINMLDYASIIVINKFEKNGSLDALTEVRKQFRRNHREFEKLDPSLYPVFGTIASRFADPGVDAAFAHLLKIKKSDTQRIPLATPLTVLNPFSYSIVPKDRTQYLLEIAKTVRGYHETSHRECQTVTKIEGYQHLIEDPALSASVKHEVETALQKERAGLSPSTQGLLKDYPKMAERYRGDTFDYQVRNQNFSVPLYHESLSHNKIRKISLPNFRSQSDLLHFLYQENLPGYFPFTAGVFPFKRTEEDPKRMFAGEGTPTKTNKRFHLLCEGEKAKRLSTAFDSVTLYGENPDERPDIFGKIGESGVSVCTLDDAKKLYSRFDLSDPTVSVSMTINGPAPILLAFYFNAAIDQQVDQFVIRQQRQPSDSEYSQIKETTLRSVRGTVQADILKEDQAQNTCIFSIEFALRMMGDIQQYFIDHQIKNYYSVSISGYHIAEAGANPISQLAFTLSNGFTFAEYYLSRGMKIDDFAANFSFFFSTSLDAEYTVIGRVARRIWAIAMRDRYGANDRSQKLKYHIQTSGRSLHAQEISFNDIRTTLQAVIAYFDNCNSLHTNAYDEAVTTPTEESVRRAMAIQLIIAKELGWAKNENPLQGSFFINELTDLVEEAVLKEFEKISVRGGVLGAMETQYQRSQIQEESLYYEHLKHSGELPLIGVNSFLNPNTTDSSPSFPSEITRATYTEKNEQITNLRAFEKLHIHDAPPALKKLKEAARKGENIFEVLMEAARVCSLGQMSHALYEVGGQYRRGI